MKKMKYHVKKAKQPVLRIICIAVMCCMLFTLVSCDGKPSYKAMGEKGTQTILIYMCGSTLETKAGAASQNLTEMMGADIPDSTSVIIQTGGTKKWRGHDIDASVSQRYQVKNNALTMLSEFERQNMGDAQTLSDFLIWGVENYPAEKMAVILWDHGGGSLSGVCFDENYSMDSLSLKELNTAFSEASKHMTDIFEYIGFDACLMANYETAATVGKYARNMIASEELEPSGGWDYGSVISYFGEQDYYSRVLNSYRDKCEKKNLRNYTLSHIDLSGFSEISDEFNKLASFLFDTAKNGLKPIVGAAKNAVAFGYNSLSEGYSNLIDLADFAAQLRRDAPGQAIDKYIARVNGDDLKSARGISFFFPVQGTEFVTDYTELSDSEPYRRFLRTYYSPVDDNSLIAFTDRGSNDNGELHIGLTADSLQYIYNAEYHLYQFVNASDYEQRIFGLGADSDLIADKDGSLTTSFEGRWITLNGNFLNCSVIDRTGDITVFSAPLKVNGLRGTLRFSYNAADGGLKIQGFLPASTGGAAERLREINPGDSITVLYDERNADYTVSFTDGASFTADGELALSVKPLPDGYYQSYIVITDIFGNRYFSNDAVIINENGELRIETISEDVDHTIV